MQRILNDSRVGRFAVAVMAAPLALLCHLALEPLAGPASLWLCSIAGVIFGAWYGGLKPGLITTFLLVVSSLYFNVAAVPNDPDRSPEYWAIAIFALLSLAVCIAMQRLRMERFETIRAKSQLAEALESTQDIVLSVDPELRCVYANARAGQLAKKPPAQLLGRSLRTIFPETPGTVIYRELNHVLLDHAPTRFQDRLEAAKRWFEFEATPVSSGINLFIRDITDRKKAELAQIAKVRAREALYAQLNQVVREAPVGVIVVTLDLRVELANTAACEIFGTLMEPGAHLLSRQAGTMRKTDGAELAPHHWPLRGTVISGEPIINLEVDYQRPDGARLTLIVNSLALTTETGARSGAVATYSNITAIRDLQRALRASDTVA